MGRSKFAGNDNNRNMSTWTTLFGNELQTKDGKKPTEEVLKDKKMVGIYFSAHWCPPCRQFTPLLATTYEDMMEDFKDFEIVFASSDRSEDGFNEYYEQMPWTALPYAQRELKEELSKRFFLRTIPFLVFLNEQGEIITKDGRNLVVEVRGNVNKLREELLKTA